MMNTTGEKSSKRRKKMPTCSDLSNGSSAFILVQYRLVFYFLTREKSTKYMLWPLMMKKIYFPAGLNSK